jgi:NodT family efflux transporter outer membrane factor (OMF) lipoprotein
MQPEPVRNPVAAPACRGKKGWRRWLSEARRLSAGALVAASVTGCTPFRDYVHNGFKVGPNYCKPEAPVAKDWIDANDVRLRKDTPDLSHWWTVLDDPVLSGLIDFAYRQNLTLREAGFRVLEARAELGIARGEFFPQQQALFGSYQRIALSKATANAKQTAIVRFFQQWDKSFGVAWELDFWGRFRRAIEAAADVLDSSVENYDDVLVTLLGDVASTYVQIRTLQEQIRLTQANVDLQKITLGLAQARSRAGQTSALDVEQAQSNLSNTQSLIPPLKIQLRQAENRLCILLGIPPEDLEARLGNGPQYPIPTAPAEVAVGMPADLLSRRPDVRRAERDAAAQCARIGVAVSELYPHISIVGNVGYSAEHFKDLFTSNAFQGNVGPTFQWNILNYGRLVNNIRLQDARFQELIVVYQNTVLRAGQEVEDGIVAFLQSKEQEKYLGDPNYDPKKNQNRPDPGAVPAAQRAVDIAMAQYKAGTVDFNRVALLQENLVQLQDQLAQAKGNIAQGLIQIYRALGGGWEIRLPDSLHDGHPLHAGHAVQVEQVPAPDPNMPQPVDGPEMKGPQPVGEANPTLHEIPAQVPTGPVRIREVSQLVEGGRS